MTSVSVDPSGAEMDATLQRHVICPMAHEPVGYIIHSGRRTGMPVKRSFVYDRSTRRLLVIGSQGEIKHDIPLQKLMLLRKVNEREDQPSLEVVWTLGRVTVRIEGDGGATIRRWYSDLQRERVAAIADEEDKVQGLPKYLHMHRSSLCTADSRPREFMLPQRRSLKEGIQSLLSW